MQSPGVGRLLIGIATATACIASGCGSGDDLPREPISGTVTFEGQPIASGSIQFLPRQTKEGIASGGVIADGRFRVVREDGPVPGSYQVMIFASDPTQAASPVEPPGPGAGATTAEKKQARAKRSAELLPLRYNLKSELIAEVKAGGPNVYTFDLKK
jgi:hypothetical protein